MYFIYFHEQCEGGQGGVLSVYVYNIYIQRLFAYTALLPPHALSQGEITEILGNYVERSIEPV